MAYAVPADFETYVDPAYLVLITDDARSGNRNDDVIEAAVANAEARINAALSTAGYTVPVASPGDYLRSLTCRLALWALVGRKQAHTAPESIKGQWQAAEDELKRIASGELSVDEAVSASATGDVATSSDDDREWATVELF